MNLNGNPVGSMPPTEIDGDSSKQRNSYGGIMVGIRRLNETAVHSDASLGETRAHRAKWLQLDSSVPGEQQ